MYDAALQHLGTAKERSTVLRDLHLGPKGYALVTVHRAENTDDRGRLGGIVNGLAAVAGQLEVIWPVHPRVREALAELAVERIPGIRLVPAASYFDMLVLCTNARLVLTDSGGLQREAFFLRTPCLTLRDETEWPETVEAGWNRVVGTTTERIVAAADDVTPGSNTEGVFGNGDAAERIVAVLAGADP